MNFRMGEEVFVTMGHQKVEVARNPARALWGSLKSKKSVEELRDMIMVAAVPYRV